METFDQKTWSEEMGEGIESKEQVGDKRTSRAQQEGQQEEVGSGGLLGFNERVMAEARAARERAIVPIDIRMKQFRDMLAEKEVR